MSDKKKLDGNTPENENYRDEMDELVRIFKEELSKAQEEAEENEDFDVDNIEVEGYDPKTVSLDEKRRVIVDFDNNCRTTENLLVSESPANPSSDSPRIG